MKQELLQRIVEAALMASNKPLNTQQIQQVFEDEERPSKQQIDKALAAIGLNTEGRGFELIEVASGWRFQVRQELSPWVTRLWDERPQKYSRALLETLALVSYRQPITRGDIENIRGVAVSSNIMRTLLDRGWVKVVGHRDVPGRPAMYATTREFLDYFNLKSLDELPTLSEIRDLDNLNQELNLSSEDSADKAQAEANARNERLQVDVTVEEDSAPTVQDDLLDTTDDSSNLSNVPDINKTLTDEAEQRTKLSSETESDEDSLIKQNIDRAMAESPLTRSADILGDVAMMEVDDAFADASVFTHEKDEPVRRQVTAKDVFASTMHKETIQDDDEVKDAFNDDALLHFSDDIDPAFLEDDD